MFFETTYLTTSMTSDKITNGTSVFDYTVALQFCANCRDLCSKREEW